MRYAREIRLRRVKCLRAWEEAGEAGGHIGPPLRECRNNAVGAALRGGTCGHGRKPGEHHLIRLTAFGTFPSRGRQHLIRRAALGTFPSRGRQHLIRPCGPPSPQGEGFGGSSFLYGSLLFIYRLI